MTWTYSNPSASTRDAVRFLIGDTDSTDPLLSNEEIDYTLTEAGNSVYQAAHDACYAIGSKFVRLAQSKSVGDMSISYANRGQQYMDQAERLLELAARREPPTPWISPKNIVRASDKLGGENGTEFWTGQEDYFRGADYFRPQP
jgi:hypothetical protein